jgi:hypothetical protein
VDKKNFILNTSKDFEFKEDMDVSLVKLTNKLINQEGTATK